MKNLKLMLLGFILFVFCIKTSYGEVYIISRFVPGFFDYSVLKEVCEHTYTDKEIKILEKAADRGNSIAQLKLGILHDIKSIQRYQQVGKNQNISSDNKEIIEILTKQRFSPCIHLKNIP